MFFFKYPDSSNFCFLLDRKCQQRNFLTIMQYYSLIRLSQSIYGVENTNSSVLMWAIGSMMRGSVSQMNAFCVLRSAPHKPK